MPAVPKPEDELIGGDINLCKGIAVQEGREPAYPLGIAATAYFITRMRLKKIQ